MSPQQSIETTQIDVAGVELTVATEAGPRILGARLPGGPQLFAELPGLSIEHPAIGTYWFLGGHRLWRAPEQPAISYAPDHHEVRLVEAEDRIELTGAPDPDGVVKVIDVGQREGVIEVRHALRNDGSAPVRLAPWAITQMALGGTALLPQASEPADPDGVLPNRNIVLWPYTDVTAPELSIDADRVVVDGSPSRTILKVGISNRRGWVAYLLEDCLFVKWSPVHADASAYPDMGASVQCYRNDSFLELESVGPLSDLAPGAQAVLTEFWAIHDVRGRDVVDVLDRLPSSPEGVAS